MDEKEFEKLIRRYLSGRASDEETALVEKWLDHRAQKDAFSELSASEKQKISADIFNRVSSEIEGRRPSVAKPASRVTALAFYWAAAAILLLGVLSYTLLNVTATAVEEKIALIHSVSSGDETKKVILSDSSIIWLKGNSSIVYPEKFDGKERHVRLTGEALFEVSKDPDHPFIIQCGGLTAKVLGTSFNIKSSKTDIEVLVLTGKVMLSSRGNTEGLVVHPSEKAVYNEAQNQMAKVIVREKEKIAKTTGTDYSMRFHATMLKEIIRRIEGKFDVRVSLSDERLGNCTITADFTDQSLDRTLSMISQTLDIKYERVDNQVIIKGEGCD